MDKNGNSTWKIIATIGSFIVVIIGAAIAYGMMYKDAERTHEEVDEVKAEVKALVPRVSTNAQNNAEVSRDIFYMQQDIEEIKEDNKDIKKGVDAIIEKMDK